MRGATPPTNGISTLSTAGSTTNVVAASSSSCSVCTRTTSLATSSARSHGRWSASRRSPKPTRCTRSRRSGDRDASPAVRARHCIRRASRSPFCTISVAQLASTTLPASISNPPHPWAAAWSRQNGSSTIVRTNGRSASSIVQSWDTANKATELSDFSVCTTWGVKGKTVYLLGRLRQRLEYPALKRAVREQQNLYHATEILIEDKASGTQLIQELIADGCHGVTRYQPDCDKIMRMHAQTAMIENGFVHIPESAPWLAEYLHEMTVFPNGKHDDQVDSTAQFLDWFKKPFPGQGIFEFYQREAEKLKQEREPERRKPPRPVNVRVKTPPGTGAVQISSGQHINVGPDGIWRCLRGMPFA